MSGTSARLRWTPPEQHYRGRQHGAPRNIRAVSSIDAALPQKDDDDAYVRQSRRALPRVRHVPLWCLHSEPLRMRRVVVRQLPEGPHQRSWRTMPRSGEVGDADSHPLSASPSPRSTHEVPMPSWNEKSHVIPTINVNLKPCDCDGHIVS